MRVVLAINARLSRGAALGPGKVGYSLARGLFDEGRLGKVLCYSADQTVDLAPGLMVETQDSAWKRKAMGAGYRISRLIPALPYRRFEERYFDVKTSRKLARDWGDLLFCSKPVNPDLIEQARHFGWLTVLSTSILHPRFNLEMVRREQTRLGLDAPSVYTDERRVRHLERALDNVDRIVAANDFFRENYGQYGVDVEKFVLPHPERPHEGVNAEHFSPPVSGVVREGKFRVLHVSHMTLIKGIQYLLEAWKQVESEIDGELVLVGSCDANVNELLRRSEVRKIRLTGPQNPIDEYQRASLFISPSISDAGPNTVFEAMACGTPAIVSDHCGVSRFIDHGVNGFTYAYQNSQHLADMILECYRNREKRQAVAEQALITARQFPMSDYAAEILAMLNRLNERMI